jgi:Tol biopolymer transport system component
MEKRMTEELSTTDENQVSEEPMESSGSRLWAYLLPVLALAILAAVVVGAYSIYASSGGISLLSPHSSARIAFMSDRDGNWDIYIMDRDGNNVQNLTNSPAREGIPIHVAGQDKLIFASDQDGPMLDVFSIDLDGSNVSNITQAPDSNELPINWSPDGETVVFASDRDGMSQIFLVGPSGAGLINLTQRDGAQSFDDWSEETDQFILTAMSEAGPSLLITDLGGDSKQALTDGSYPAGGGNWSPDGQKVAFMAIGPEASSLDIFVAEVSGGEAVNLTQSPSNDSFPRWSPDGSKIAFVSDRDGNSEIYVMDADGSNPTNLTNSPGQESIQGDYSWSPDGSQILFHTNRDNSDVEIYVMDADGSNQVNLSNMPGTDYYSVWVE